MIQNLSDREKRFVTVGAVALPLIFVIFAIILPFRGAVAGLDDKSVEKEQQLKQVLQLQSDYQQLDRKLSSKERKIGGKGSLLTEMESMVSRLGFRDRLLAMRPRESSERQGMQVEAVSVRLESITLQQLVELLQSVERSSMLLNATGLQVRTRFDDPSRLDVDLEVETVKRRS